MYYETTDYNIRHNLENTSIGVVGLDDQRKEREFPAALRVCASISHEHIQRSARGQGITPRLKPAPAPDHPPFATRSNPVAHCRKVSSG